MADVGFYHLLLSGPDRSLPTLLGRTLGTGHRAVVVCGSDERVAALDAALWLATDPDWLPHGTVLSGHPELQPIWLATDDCAPNGARFLFLLDGCTSARLDAFERVFDLFDGRDGTAVAAARRRWVAAKAAGHRLTYWQQTERRWERRGS
jgi:DNA polymerase-3 subunit chi